MFFSNEVMVGIIEHRIHILKERGEEMNSKLIAALKREKRALEGVEQCQK